MARDSEIARTPELLAVIESILKTGSRGALITLINGHDSVGAKLLVREDGVRIGTLADSELDAVAVAYAPTFLGSRQEAKAFSITEISPVTVHDPDARLLFELIAPEPRLIVCGAGHVGAALARLGAPLGFATTLIDDRRELLRPELFPAAKISLSHIEDWSAGVLDLIGNGRGAHVAIVTRGHREDEECLRSVLLSEPDYVGMIGSRRRTNIVLDRLRAAGFRDDVLNEVRAPIGLDIGAVSPEEVALSVMSEIVMHRRGGTALPMSAWRRAKS